MPTHNLAKSGINISRNVFALGHGVNDSADLGIGGFDLVAKQLRQMILSALMDATCGRKHHLPVE